MTQIGTESLEAPAVPAGPWRRLGAMLYDMLLVIGLLAVATLVALPFTGGRSPIEVGGAAAVAYRIAVLAVWAGFFVYFWAVKARTLGMQAWRLRIERGDGGPVTPTDALLRLAAATVPWLPSALAAALASITAADEALKTGSVALLVLIPLNYFAAWLDPGRRSLHDRWLRTRIVRRRESE